MDAMKGLRIDTLQRLKDKTRGLRREVLAMYLALRHPATPWYAKLLAGLVVVYAVSPFDLIPDPIPILGYLDDIILVPLGVLAVRRMIPQSVLMECREKAAQGVQISARWKCVGGLLIATLWLLCAMGLAWIGWRWMRS